MNEFALHPSIEPITLKRSFAETGRARVAPFLRDDQAIALAEHLRQRTDWRWIFNVGDKVYELPRSGANAVMPDQEARLRAAIDEQARDQFQYSFESIRVPDERTARDRQDPLHAFAEFMCGDTVMTLMRTISGVQDIAFADAQGTIFRTGDFLTAHDDAVASKNRKAAYVFGLTSAWRAEWGGLLLFHDEGGDVSGGLMPRANSLTLFAVPQVHSVSSVNGSAGVPRCSITGWLRTRA